jgi:hypothetical protein
MRLYSTRAWRADCGAGHGQRPPVLRQQYQRSARRRWPRAGMMSWPSTTTAGRGPACQVGREPGAAISPASRLGGWFMVTQYFLLQLL